jgi:glycosyltransferase involved in cell wall biosynthesis
VEWERREYVFRNGSRYATLLLADSEVGKEDILNFYGPYGVTPDRVKVLPFLPASYLSIDVAESDCQRVRTTYHLPNRYLFYPAQFWPHKNHTRIVQALALLKRDYQLEVPVVFCGTSAGPIGKRTFQQVRAQVKHLAVDNQVFYLGYVRDDDMSALYARAEALIMPTFFGPTNIPPLEAWSFGCPVITSDIRGIREQMGDAALLVDPRSVESIALGIARLWKDQNLRQNLIVRGRDRLASNTPVDYANRLKAIIDEAKDRVRCVQEPKILLRESLFYRPC